LQIEEQRGAAQRDLGHALELLRAVLLARCTLLRLLPRTRTRFIIALPAELTSLGTAALPLLRTAHVALLRVLALIVAIGALVLPALLPILSLCHRDPSCK
jgi:hypothetical protein